MKTIEAKAGHWLFNGESFVHKVAGFGSLDQWQEVSQEYKDNWDKEHPALDQDTIPEP